MVIDDKLEAYLNPSLFVEYVHVLLEVCYALLVSMFSVVVMFSIR